MENLPAPLTMLAKLLGYFSFANLNALLDLYQRVRKLWHHESDLYEILDYAATLELLDGKGENAHFTKHQKIRFLQNQIIAFEDYVWGDGDVMVDYRCSPGVVVDRYREADRWNVLISLRETKHKEDVLDFHIERTEKRAFTRAQEWIQTELRHPARRLEMNVIFPKQRGCKRALIVRRSRNQTTILGSKNIQTLPDGGQLVTWSTDKIYGYEVFTLQWSW